MFKLSLELLVKVLNFYLFDFYLAFIAGYSPCQSPTLIQLYS